MLYIRGNTTGHDQGELNDADLEELERSDNWPLACPWVLHGDFLADKPMLPSRRPAAEESKSDDEEFQVPLLIWLEGRIARRIRRGRRAQYVERVAEALMDLKNEDQEEGKCSFRQGQEEGKSSFHQGSL